jgi:hypothetical protein
MSRDHVKLKIVDAGVVERRSADDSFPLFKNMSIDADPVEAEYLCRWGVARRADEPAGEKRSGRRSERACRMPGED